MMASCSDGGAGSSARPKTLQTDPDERYDFNVSVPDDDNTEHDQDVDAESNPEEPMTSDPPRCRFKAPTPCPPVIDLRGREVIFAIAVFFLFSVSIGLIVILASSKLADGKKNKQERTVVATNGKRLCLTKECLSTAAYMLETMNASADPCGDFWNYACGGWLAKNTIPASQKAWSVDYEIKKRINDQLRTYVERPIVKDIADSTERKVKIVYRKCMDVDAIEDLGAQPIIDIVDTMGGWAVSEDWNLGFKSGRWNFQTVLETLHFNYWTDVLFTIWVGPDQRDARKNILQLDQSGLGMMSSQDYSRAANDTLIVAYKNFMRAIARQFTTNEKRIDHFVNKTFSFEKKLAALMVSDTEAHEGNPDAMYTHMTLADLTKLAPRINWVKFFRRNVTTVSEQTVVAITLKDYMSNMSQLVERTDARTLNYYLMWQLVSNLAAVLSRPFRVAKEDFESVQGGTRQTLERSRVCVRAINDWMGLALGAIYVTSNFPEHTKQDVTEMIVNIRNNFRGRLESISWIDSTTRRNALKKLDAMVYRTGYPDFLLNTSRVEQYYQHFHVSDNDTYFRAKINSIHCELRRMLDDLHRLPSSDMWEMNPHEVNAYYFASENQMVFPAGVLQKPYYSVNVPNYVNYGGIGSTIGHELIHGFDYYGSEYDSDGNLNRWWSDESWSNFENRTKCISNYYSSLMLGGVQVNGDLTLGENIADVGGLIQSYQAYKDLESRIKVEEAMPGLGLSNDQTFFLAFGQNWCMKRTPESLREVLVSSPHAPAEIRMRGTLSQMTDFSKAFNCKKNSPMNPPRKCSVW